MAQLSGQHRDLAPVVPLVGREIREKPNDVAREAGDLSASVHAQFEQAHDPLATPPERRQQLLRGHSPAVHALGDRKAVLCAASLDPHTAAVVEVTGDHAHRATRRAGHRFGPQIVRKVLQQEGRDAVVDLPRLNDSASWIRQSKAFAEIPHGCHPQV